VLSAHVRESYSSQSVGLCTVDLEGRCITAVETSTNVKKRMIKKGRYDHIFGFLHIES